MTMQPRPSYNPIERKKYQVRKTARNGVIGVAGGLGGGLLLAFVMAGSSWPWLILGLSIAVISGVVSWQKINKIVNENHSGI